MTEGSPMGEWVDLDSPPRPLAPNERPEDSSGGWVGSSFDLLRGTQVSDDPDTVPDALLDELFSTRCTPPTKAPKEKP
jgi:hypothetical protein